MNDEYEHLKNQLEFFCNQELHIQQVANRIADRADPSQRALWIACINHQRDCFNHHAPLIQFAEQTLDPIFSERLFQISYNHSLKISNTQKIFTLR